VNDTKLELSYKIKNNTDHDVWICDSVNAGRTFNIDVYLAEDAQTLVIMKRIDVVSEFWWVDGIIVPISRVVAGQAVRRSLCTTPGPWPDRVEGVQEHTGTFECRDIVLESGNHIGVVDSHCFMLANGQWIAAQDLKSGLSLRTLQGTVRIKSVTVRAAPYTGKVYNLKIKNSDEYVVGRDGIIVRDY